VVCDRILVQAIKCLGGRVDFVLPVPLDALGEAKVVARCLLCIPRWNSKVAALQRADPFFQRTYAMRAFGDLPGVVFPGYLGRALAVKVDAAECTPPGLRQGLLPFTDIPIEGQAILDCVLNAAVLGCEFLAELGVVVDGAEPLCDLLIFGWPGHCGVRLLLARMAWSVS
jgi:hypothetical protein